MESLELKFRKYYLILFYFKRYSLQYNVKEYKMKTPALSIILFSLSILSLSSAQIKEENSPMSQGIFNSFSIVLDGVDTKLADQVLKEYFKKYGGKYKWNRKFKEHEFAGIFLNNINKESTLDLFAQTKSTGSDVVLTVWLRGESGFLESGKNPESFEATEIMLQHLAREVAREKLRNTIKDEERAAAKLESDLNKLQRRKENLHNEIEKAKQRITDAENEIQVNEKEQSQANLSIKRQQELIEQLKRKLNEL